MIKRLFSHTAIYGVAPQVIKLANFFALPIITADLTAVDYGVSGVLTAYTAAISVFAAIGLRVVLINGFYKSPSQYKWLWRQIYGFLTIWNAVYAAVLATLLYFVIPTEALDNRWTIVLLNVGPLVFFGQTSTICSTYYQLSEKPLQIATRSLVFGVATVLLNIFFITVMKMGYMGWFWSNFIVGLALNLSYYYPLNFVLKMTPIFNFKWRLIKKSLRVSIPTIPHFYSVYLLNLSDRAVMSVLKIGTADIGRYNVASTLAGAMGALSNASGQSIGPMLSKLYKKGEDGLARDLVFVLQVVFLTASFGICIWMREIFTFMIRNAELATMYKLGVIIVMSYNYRPMYLGSNQKLMYTENTGSIWKVTFLAGVSNVALNFALIPIFGFEVAAYTTFASYMYMGYAGFFFKIFATINKPDYYPLAWLGGTILLTVLAYWMVDLSIWVKIFTTIIFAVAGVISLLRLNERLSRQ